MQAEDLPSDIYGEIVRVVRKYGLRPAQSRGNVRAFAGPFKCSHGEVRIRFEISDWDFESYPLAKVLQQFPDGHRIHAHVDAEGGLCYFSPESVVLDRYEPEIAIHQCLHAIESVLDKALSSGSDADANVQNEFLAYWSFGQLPPARSVLVDDLPSDAIEASVFSCSRADGERRTLVSESADRARMLIEGLGFGGTVELAYACYLFKSKFTPAAPAGAFPATIYQFFDWLKSWDRSLLREIRSRLASDAQYLRQDHCVLAIASPVGRFGVQFEHDRKHRLGFLRDPAAYCNFLHGEKGGRTPVDRLRFDDIGATYIHSRNLEFESLAGKRLRLVGCGAIGGYLASALVRLGAGTGKGGLLSLYDPGTLEAENLGRHALGFKALFHNKAKALRDELMSHFPYVNIEARGEKQTYNDEFFATDLIIDATGNEAHSEKLNFYHLARRLSPVLYIRVMGNGECVQTMFCDSDRFACFRCLRQGKGGNYREERFPVLKSALITRFRGCASFTPYAVSSSLSAAALATDAVIDWLKGAPTPRFRTRRVESVDTRLFPNKDLAPIKGCPACHRNS